MRHILIDTDTGSDDVWAIIAALRATEDVHVDAITVVCGNGAAGDLREERTDCNGGRPTPISRLSTAA